MAGDAGVRELLGDIAVVADELSDPSAAELVRSQQVATGAAAGRVVVVGEKKRGKSSLINALLRRPGLLPVDSDIATSVHVTVYAADADEATVIDDEHPEDGFAIQLVEIGEYAALDPLSGEMRHAGVREVSVGLDSGLLHTGLQLIDTPGVGGLVAGHGHLSLAALSLADALLFVVNGSSEMTKSEYEFLKQATERVAVVMFVLTQTDKYGSWPAVLAENRRLVGEHAPRFANAPWFPVSSVFMEDAVVEAAAGNRADAMRLAARSQLGPLEETLTKRIAGHATVLRELNAAHVAQRAIAKLTKDAQAWRRSLDGDPGLAQEVADKKAALAKYRADGKWQRDLDTECAKLSQEMLRLYQRRLVELQDQADEWISMATTESAPKIAHDLEAGLHAMWGDLVAAVRQGTVRIAAQVAASINADGIDALLDSEIPFPDQLAAAGTLPDSGDGVPESFSEQVTRMWPALSGFSITAMAAHTLLVGIVIPPLAIVAVGGLAAYILSEGNKKRADKARARAELQRHIQGELRKAGAVMTGPLLDKVEEARGRIRTAISRAMEAREKELNEAFAAANRNRLASEQALMPQRARADAALARLRALDKRTAQAVVDAQTAINAAGSAGPGSAGTGPGAA
jgi:Dynamin family